MLLQLPDQQRSVVVAVTVMLHVVLQVVLLSSKMGSQGAHDIPPGGGLVSANLVVNDVMLQDHMLSCIANSKCCSTAPSIGYNVAHVSC